MDEKLKKALRTSKQGAWALLILLVGAVVIRILFTSSSLESYFSVMICIGALITGLVLYGKEKYAMGAEVLQWIGLGTIILNISNIVITYAFTGVFTLQNLAGVIPLLNLLIAIVLIVDALKVIRLTEEPGHVNKVTVPAIIIIAVIIIINILTAVQAKQQIDDLMSGSKDQINNGILNKNENTDNTDDEEQNKPAADNQEENKENNQQSEKEPEKVDPYANYKNLNWSTTSASAGTITSADIKIINGKVYVTYQEEVKEVTGIEGTPIKVAYTPGAMLWFEVLTKEGKVYSISDWETKAELYISKYNIIDMTTYAGEEPAKPNYYLTSDGKLIDKNGVSYDKYSFVDKFVYIPFDKNNYGYINEADINTYTAIKDKATGEKIKISQIYFVEGHSTVVIISDKNKAYELKSEDGFSATLIGEVSSVERVGNGYDFLTLAVRLQDGTQEWFEKCAETGYDVVNKKEINVISLKEIVPKG